MFNSYRLLLLLLSPPEGFVTSPKRERVVKIAVKMSNPTGTLHEAARIMSSSLTKGHGFASSQKLTGLQKKLLKDVRYLCIASTQKGVDLTEQFICQCQRRTTRESCLRGPDFGNILLLHQGKVRMVFGLL